MSKGRRHGQARYTNVLLPYKGSEHLTEEDREVLKEEPGLPLERGGIYSEMGADMTFEEMNSFPINGKEYTHYEQHSEQSNWTFTEIIGVMFVFLGLFIVMISPFWFSSITLGIALVVGRYQMRITMTTAIIFMALGFAFALYSLN